MTNNPDETLPVELLPCPFCGGKPEHRWHAGPAGWLECGECSAIGPQGEGDDDWPTIEAKWNTRAAQSPPPVVSEGREDVQRFAIRVEKLLCAKLGIPWAATGISIESLIERLSSPSRGCDAGEDYGPGSPWSEGYNSGFAAASREPSRGCDLETVEAAKLCAEVEADAVSALRYIETHYGRLSGIGWDRVFDAHDRLFAMGRNLGKETREGEG